MVRWKQILHEYFPFCILQYGLIAMIGTKFSMVFSYKVGSAIVTFIFFTVLFGLVMVIGVAIRDFKPKLKLMGGFVVAIGAALQGLYIYMHESSVMTCKIVVLFLVATFIMSTWSIILFFMHDGALMAEVRRKSKRKSAVYYALAITLFTYASTLLLYSYYDRQINALVTSGSSNRTDGLSAAQVITIADEKILHVDLLQTIFLIVVTGVFLLPYRKWVLGPDSRAVGNQA
jgi:hypothetical protein